MHVVEHYTDGFDPDSIASGSIVQKSQEKDIIFSPIEKDVPIERLKENVMGAAVTIQSVISKSRLQAFKKVSAQLERTVPLLYGRYSFFIPPPILVEEPAAVMIIAILE